MVRLYDGIDDSQLTTEQIRACLAEEERRIEILQRYLINEGVCHPSEFPLVPPVHEQEWQRQQLERQQEQQQIESATAADYAYQYNDRGESPQRSGGFGNFGNSDEGSPTSRSGYRGQRFGPSPEPYTKDTSSVDGAKKEVPLTPPTQSTSMGSPPERPVWPHQGSHDYVVGPPVRQVSEKQGEEILASFAGGVESCDDFFKQFMGVTTMSSQADEILAEKFNQWRSLSRVPQLREKFSAIYARLHTSRPENCRTLDTEADQATNTCSGSAYLSPFIRFVRDFFIAPYVHVGAVTVDNSRHSAVDEMVIRVDETPLLDEQHLTGERHTDWVWKAFMKQGKYTQVVFIKTQWPHDMLQQVCDKFAEVVNEFIKKKHNFKELPRHWTVHRTCQYLIVTSPTLRNWDTLQVWACYYRQLFRPENSVYHPYGNRPGAYRDRGGYNKGGRGDYDRRDSYRTGSGGRGGGGGGRRFDRGGGSGAGGGGSRGRGNSSRGIL
ncbi:unnamed protein product [Vitrella brassicaformis CCMP3155]|uniref:Uncharacterized protein n=1 Tax=Vitrella brassicaformis (strain CCMP3155) TaxID=1169540 RepID=A0A0G4H0V6_VITBC|nr:unnamed protein product [Vitrella brassicaformis CCMP3155]|eukprot:CEM37205.1 unnamed protein product [Vitrella brassicaformis CCMP3155]